MTASHATDPTGIDRYDTDGYAIVRGVLDKNLIAEADQHVDRLLEQNPELRADQLGHVLARTDPFWFRLIADPRLLDLVEPIIGPDIGLFATHYLCKEPFSGRAVPWHQDGGYWPLDPMEVVTVWLAVTASDESNGALRVIPGSHRQSLMELVPTGRDEALALEVPVEVDERRAVTLALNPGDVSVHHPNIVHGSRANTSDRWRRGLTIRYIPTSTRITSLASSRPQSLYRSINRMKNHHGHRMRSCNGGPWVERTGKCKVTHAHKHTPRAPSSWP